MPAFLARTAGAGAALHWLARSQKERILRRLGAGVEALQPLELDLVVVVQRLGLGLAEDQGREAAQEDGEAVLALDPEGGGRVAVVNP